VAAFATHPHWDHVLWHPELGDAPRYGTAAAAAYLQELLARTDWREQVADGLPPEQADDIPMDLLGLITGLPARATEVPWDGPRVRIIEHRAHSAGHAALLVEQSGVLVAGDMLSDILMPFLDLRAAHPLDDYLDALDLLEGVADEVTTVIPGHGTVGDAAAFRARLDQDRAYVTDVRDTGATTDPRVGPTAPLDWLPDVHDFQVRILARNS
jgi:glyoxylase-like metal-dependent hydrolase (beta-lactamase superfamily II)